MQDFTENQEEAFIDLCAAILAVGIILPDDTPLKPSVVYGHPTSREWATIFIKAKKALER